MDSFDEILRIPEQYFNRPGRWEGLVFNQLFRILCQAVREKAVNRVEELLNPWYEQFIHFNQQFQPQWEVLQHLLICAKITKLDRQGVAGFSELLTQFDSKAHVPDQMTCHGASLDDPDHWPTDRWQQFVRQELESLKFSSPLSAEWAWDTIKTMWNSSREVTRSEKMTVLFVLQSINQGITATLILELLPSGRGIFYPDPASMSFVSCEDADFQQSIANALAHIHQRGLRMQDRQVDVRWKLKRQDGKPLPRIEGGSLGGAFALGLAKLLAGE